MLRSVRLVSSHLVKRATEENSINSPLVQDKRDVTESTVQRSLYNVNGYRGAHTQHDPSFLMFIGIEQRLLFS